ncbi:MAG: 2-phosphosulfolactate phosphatase [Candidatus Zixiibacteriota bacterium]
MVHIDWGPEGLRYSLRNGDIAIIVDTLRFSSTAVIAVSLGFTVYPVSSEKRGRTLAAAEKAELAGQPGRARFSLSPGSFLENRNYPNKKVVLVSPNGARCSELVGDRHTGLIGCFLNARAVAAAADKIAARTHQNITLIAAGEQRAVMENDLVSYVRESSERVFAVEDYLGCGAVISYLQQDLTPDAQVCRGAFESARENLSKLLTDCLSGRWLVQKNMKNDLEHLARLNYYEIVPAIINGKIERLKYVRKS